ncbi:MAG: HEAT repeat domain-containing protein [Cyanobacteria bacterium P01_H01_bin.130]
MDLEQIKQALTDGDPQERVKAMRLLRDYPAEVAVPLLESQMGHGDFLVRSCIAKGLGLYPSDRTVPTRKKLLDYGGHSVRAEAAGALGNCGSAVVPDLLDAFRRDDNWLVRRSVLESLVIIRDLPALFEVCELGVQGKDVSVAEASVDALTLLSKTELSDRALELLLPFVSDEWWQLRWRVARALRFFEQPKAIAARQYLAKDEDHRVVGAALEAVVSPDAPDGDRGEPQPSGQS